MTTRSRSTARATSASGPPSPTSISRSSARTRRRSASTRTASGGFTPQTWDVGGNEANFFVRDVTGGSKLPFRIRPGAPTSSVDITANGNVGIGIAAPTAPLDVQRGNGTAKVRVAETDATTALRNLVDLVNNGPANISYTDTSPGTHPTWLAGTGGADGNDFLINTQGSAVPPLAIGAVRERPLGRRALPERRSGPAWPTSSRSIPTRSSTRSRTLPLQTWAYAGDAAGGRHIGPKAADFKSASASARPRRQSLPATSAESPSRACRR